jgi:aminoglycoside phosphotransferase family enzyme/predicted kinase
MTALPDGLLDPAAYPDPPSSVELRETHISWVFLAGETVYKVKKPVRFPFLDYGSPATRRRLCHAEVDLNRRFARSVYRGVAGIAPRDGGLAIVDEAAPDAIDYAVVMRRFDEADTLAARLGSVDASELERVGAAVAAFHAAAPVCEAADLAGVVEETLDTLAGAGAPVAALDRFCRAALRAFGPLLAERAAAGHVRDGHGDLRAEHILLGDRIEAVDGVEFDPALRIADVGYDFAFLVMDVAGVDGGLARALVRGYDGDLGPLDFFCVIRALVRAKVDFLRAAQLSGAAAQERTARALERLALAERFAWRVRLPELTCVTGLPASGKSTLAEALGAAAGRPVLSSDRVRKQRAGVDPYARAGAEAYSDAESRAVYAALAAAADEGGVIVDATFRRAADVEAFRAAATHEPAWIVCEAPPEVLLERAAARAARGSISDADPAVVRRELERHRGPFRAPGPELARLQTTRPVAELLEELAAALDERLSAGAPPPR